MPAHQIMRMSNSWACHYFWQCSKLVNVFARKYQHITVGPSETEDRILILLSSQPCSRYKFISTKSPSSSLREVWLAHFGRIEKSIQCLSQVLTRRLLEGVSIAKSTKQQRGFRRNIRPGLQYSTRPTRGTSFRLGEACCCSYATAFRNVDIQADMLTRKVKKGASESRFMKRTIDKETNGNACTVTNLIE